MALRPATTARRIGAVLAPVTAASQADDRKARHPGSHHMIIRVTFDRAAGPLPGTQMYGHRHPDIEQAYSAGLLLPFAAIRNQAGTYVTLSAQTVAADAAQRPAITSSDFSIVNQPGADSYPISGYSWALIYTRQPSQATGQALVAMLDWLTHDGQAYAAANGYVPLPAQVQQLARTMLQQITGPSGTSLLS